MLSIDKKKNIVINGRHKGQERESVTIGGQPFPFKLTNE